mmetsp:Transcript_15283/g.31011  ORF Transcript_15283/g.31011 Transcript_15283/m.31011 type:complete len:202 (-) Transcript_15283:278-883(-)
MVFVMSTGWQAHPTRTSNSNKHSDGQTVTFPTIGRWERCSHSSDNLVLLLNHIQFFIFVIPFSRISISKCLQIAIFFLVVILIQNRSIQWQFRRRRICFRRHRPNHQLILRQLHRRHGILTPPTRPILAKPLSDRIIVIEPSPPLGHLPEFIQAEPNQNGPGAKKVDEPIAREEDGEYSESGGQGDEDGHPVGDGYAVGSG